MGRPWQIAHDTVMRTVMQDGLAATAYGLTCSRLKALTSLSNNPFVSAGDVIGTRRRPVSVFVFAAGSRRRHHAVPIHTGSAPPVCRHPEAFVPREYLAARDADVVYAGNYSLFARPGGDIVVVVGFSACNSKATSERRIKHMHLCIASRHVMPSADYRYVYSGMFTATSSSSFECQVYADSGSFKLAKRIMRMFDHVDAADVGQLDQANVRFSGPYVRAAVSAATREDPKKRAK